jgi:plastocyanin
MPDRSPTRIRRHGATLAVLPALLVVLAACSSGTTASAPASQAPSQTGVTLSGLAFSTDEITIPVGNLTFTNEDGVAHVLAEGENGVEVASPRVQKVTINGGTQGDLVFTAAGDYHITCTIHHAMNMVVHVQ